MPTASLLRLPRAAAAALSLLLALLSTPLTAALSQHSTAQVSTAAHRLSTPSTTESVPDVPQLDTRTPLGKLLPGQEAEGVVTGIAGPQAQAEFAAAEALRASDRGRRALLHGKKRPRDYTLCPRCTLVSCVTGTNTCSGHCKTSRALFTCRSSQRVAPPCPPADSPQAIPPPDPRTVPPDSLFEAGSALVETTAPFIGCANITGTANGCPDRGTTGTVAGRGRVEVVTSWCVQHLYELGCFTGHGSPFHPFGYCLCLLKDEAGAVFGGPCRTSYLDWSGPDVGPDEVPVRVSSGGGETLTRFSEADDSDFFVLTLDHTFLSSAGRITSTLTVRRAELVEGVDIVEEGPLPGEEGGSPSSRVDTEAGPEGDAEDEVVDGGDGGTAEAPGVEGGEEEEEEEEDGRQSALGKFLRGFKSS